MSSSWPLVRIGDHIDSCLGKMLDKKKNKGKEMPYLGNSNVRWGSFDLSNLSLMKFEEGEHERYGIKAGDLLICEGGEPGRCAIWNEDLPEMKIQKALHRVRPKQTFNNYYLYYWFLYTGRQGLLEPYFTGTTIKHLTGKALNDLKVPLPPIEYQEFVAKILGSIDKKIQLNTQTNQTLEQIAQAIFKSWFVDFDPVRAKMAVLENGATPEAALLAAMRAISAKDAAALKQMQRETPEAYARLEQTAALFPSAMEPSELGEVPEGWRLSTIGEEVEIVGGGTPSTKIPEFWEEGEIHWTTPKDLSSLSDKVLLDTERKITEEGLKKISSGLLPVNTVLMSSRAPVGYLALAKVPVAVNQGYIAMKCEKGLTSEYVIQWAESIMEEIKQRASGTTFAEISKKNFRPISILVPSETALASYTATVKGLYEAITNNVLESRTLVELRDSLLPRLLSGQMTLEG